MNPVSSWRGVVFALACGLALLPERAPGCMSVTPDAPLYDPHTYVESERAIIIGDAKTHTEHFIREAAIHTDSEDLGFLVPTPAVPQITEANPGIFSMAETIIPNGRTAPAQADSPWTMVAPVVENPLMHTGWLAPSTLFGSDLEPVPAASGPLTEAQTAAYTASVFDARDTAGISKWMRSNGYPFSPEMSHWIHGYATKGWKITAFRFVKRYGFTGPILTTAVRLSFPTDRPFYPYSEPSDRQAVTAMSPNGRVLELTLLSNDRMRATTEDGSKWPGQLEFAGPMLKGKPEAQETSLGAWNATAAFPTDEMQKMGPLKATIFADVSNPRPGTTDLFFEPDSDQSDMAVPASVDPGISATHALAILNPLADVAALGLILLLPLVPIYCGWEILRLKTETAPRTLPEVTARLGRANYYVGIFAVAMAVYFFAQYVLLFLEVSASAVRGWAVLNWTFAWQYGVIVLAAVPMAALAWGVAACGIQIARMASPKGRAAVSHELGQSSIVRRGYMSALSLIAGGLFTLAMIEFVLPHLWAG